MKEKTKLQPKQIMFLKYLLSQTDSLKLTNVMGIKYPITPSTIRGIRYALKTGKYITGGPNCVMFNRLRKEYIKAFEIFEEQDYIAFKD